MTWRRLSSESSVKSCSDRRIVVSDSDFSSQPLLAGTVQHHASSRDVFHADAEGLEDGDLGGGGAGGRAVHDVAELADDVIVGDRVLFARQDDVARFDLRGVARIDPYPCAG